MCSQLMDGGPSRAPNRARPFICLVGGEVKREKSRVKLNTRLEGREELSALVNSWGVFRLQPLGNVAVSPSEQEAGQARRLLLSPRGVPSFLRLPKGSTAGRRTGRAGKKEAHWRKTD